MFFFTPFAKCITKIYFKSSQLHNLRIWELIFCRLSLKEIPCPKRVISSYFGSSFCMTSFILGSPQLLVSTYTNFRLFYALFSPAHPQKKNLRFLTKWADLKTRMVLYFHEIWQMWCGNANEVGGVKNANFTGWISTISPHPCKLFAVNVKKIHNDVGNVLYLSHSTNDFCESFHSLGLFARPLSMGSG